MIQKKPLSERLAAYNEIKNVFPEVIAGIRDENVLSRESLDIINKQAKLNQKMTKNEKRRSALKAEKKPNNSPK